MDFAKNIKPLSSKSDWPIWKRKIEDLLDYHEGAVDVIKGNLTKPQRLGDRPSKSQRKKFKTASDLYRKANCFAKSLINCTVSDSLYQKIMDKITAQEAWEALKLEFEATSSDRSSEITNNAAPSATVSNFQKEWQREITIEQREDLVKKLVNAFRPTNNATSGNSANLPVSIEDRVLQGLESFARKVESDTYDAANSKSEYYHSLAEKYYQLFREIDERKKKLKDQEQLQTNQLQQQQPPQVTQSDPQPETLQLNQSNLQPSPQTTANPAENSGNQPSNPGQSSPVVSQPASPPKPLLSETPQPQEPSPQPIQSSSEDVDLPASGDNSDGLPHNIDRLGLDLDEGTPQPTENQARPQEASRGESIRRCIGSLVHACQCLDARCQLSNCRRMKLIVQHTKGCKMKVNGNCPLCKQLIALCFYHAKYCKDSKCTVPVCSSIKRKINMQQVQQRIIQQQHLLQRRMAAMNSAMNPRITSSSGSGMPGSSSLTFSPKVLQALKQSQCRQSLAAKYPNISEELYELRRKIKEQQPGLGWL